MSTYNRTTRECSVAQLRPELRQAIWEYFKEHNLGDPEAESLMCCETIAEKKDAGKLASWLSGESDTIIYIGMLFTHQMLIWVRKGNQSDPVLHAANLKEIRVSAYEPLLSKELGLEIAGFIETTKSWVRGHIEMGPEAATKEFVKAVQEAIAGLNPPSKRRGLFKWLKD